MIGDTESENNSDCDSPQSPGPANPHPLQPSESGWGEVSPLQEGSDQTTSCTLYGKQQKVSSPAPHLAKEKEDDEFVVTTQSTIASITVSSYPCSEGSCSPVCMSPRSPGPPTPHPRWGCGWGEANDPFST